MLRNTGRILPKLRSLLAKRNASSLNKVQTPFIATRGFHQRRPDPFAQMENFMRDMEKKFWGEVNQNFPWFPALPRFGDASSRSTSVPSAYAPNTWGPRDVSSSDQFKLTFNFPQAKPDDIKVTLKDRLLSIEAKMEESSESSKVSQVFQYEYTIPESVDVESLESLFSHDGILTIEAPKTPEEAPRTINIKRE